VLQWLITGTAIATAVAIRGPRLKQIVGIFERLFEVAWVARVYVIAIELVKLSR